MALDIQQTTQPRFGRADIAARISRRQYMALAMAAGLFAIIVGVWRWAPDDDAPPARVPTSIVSSHGTP